ncbi:MAG: serine/threonine-protein phosphatase [Mycoplasmataceae bacterium]|nr:serine/threonine-protein phosphatase [Mycoplasmataceae bacterium]
MKRNNIFFNLSLATNRGIKEINEDASWTGINQAEQVFGIVCDGIGSEDDSQIASLITVDVFSSSFSKRRKIHGVEKWFKTCLKTAFDLITERSKKQLQSKKIGTTVLAILIEKDKVTTFNLGDTRLYHFSLFKNEWIQITKDHNLYNHLLDLYEKDKRIQLNTLCHKYKDQLFALTKCLESGSEGFLDYDVFKFTVEPGDVVFLATDGVYHYIDLSSVNDLIKNNANNNFELISRNVIQKALQNKSNDNLTSLVIECLNKNK